MAVDDLTNEERVPPREKYGSAPRCAVVKLSLARPVLLLLGLVGVSW